MTVENMTPASPSAFPAKQTIFFNQNSISNISSTFQVTTEPFYIFGFSLADGDTVTVQQVTGPGSGNQFENWEPLGKPVQLNSAQQCVRVDWPGTYRLIFSGVSVSATTVVGYAAAFGAQTIYGASAASGGGGGSTIVQGTAPIVVTGDGSSGNPYVVSISGGSGVHLTGTLPVVITGDGSSGTPFNVAVQEESQANFLAGTTTGSKIVAISTIDGIMVINDPLFTTAFGHFATQQGSNVVSMGYSAGGGTTPVVDGATIIGANSAVNVGGDGCLNSVVIGSSALASASADTGATNDVFIGSGCGESTDFLNATVVGGLACVHMHFTDSVAVGSEAANSTTAGSAMNLSVAVGSHALTLTGPFQSISKCVAVGANALSNALAGALSTSVGIGNSAGQQATASGIYIGNLAGKSETHSDVIIIGNSVDGTTPLTATANGDIILGNANQTTLRTAGSIIAGGVISASDSRLKEEIKPISGATSLLKLLQPVGYEWNLGRIAEAGLPMHPQDIRGRHFGIIAQDLQSVVPSAVKEIAGTDGELYKFVHYERLVPFLIAALNEMAARVDALEKGNG